ncbi:LysR family transcriptional regulator [Pseudomonas floridensis]|uniref:LysR family transcriptional regulator n=1 Tax=Pseudomonas floridensis TaxID=1958950 RepID=A0A1X0N598_9PSED|nr:LysR family transcriptional regulator [Pseudomonas floridensis]ORC58087.1 LysR family transcriptional regulator [Pseudomonas floridensis]
MKTHFFKIVQTVAQHGSFSEAAAILGCSQSNISYAIKEVEDFFEKRLFIRSRSGCTLTPDGKVISQTLSSIMATLEQLKKMGSAAASPSITTRIFRKPA